MKRWTTNSRFMQFATGLSAVAIMVAAGARPALGLPAFARKYGTSCITCHTVYAKLNPFGEAFRRNGYRFPGVDSDFIKQEPVSMGQEEYKKQFPHAVWPGWLPPNVPIAVGFNGAAMLHPDRNSSAALADNRARFSMGDLIEEGHVWAGGSFDENITFFGEMTISGEGAELELANVHFNDLAGPKHAMNLVVGKAIATLSTFGPRSSYLADLATTPINTTSLLGGTSDSWNVVGQYPEIELNGTINGRFDYSVGTNAGENVDVRDTENYYGHVGYKVGGVRLDGENSNVPDPMKPWAENSVTLQGFAYRSVSHFSDSEGTTQGDQAKTYGASVRVKAGSLEIDSGVYQENHDSPVFGGKVRALAQYNEASYVLFPWFVPAVRVEYLRLKPAPEASIPENPPPLTTLSDLRIFPGIAMLVRPNLKLTVIGQIEKATGMPAGTWEPAGGLAVPADPTSTVNSEIEAITLGISFAF